MYTVLLQHTHTHTYIYIYICIYAEQRTEKKREIIPNSFKSKIIATTVITIKAFCKKSEIY